MIEVIWNIEKEKSDMSLENQVGYQKKRFKAIEAVLASRYNELSERTRSDYIMFDSIDSFLKSRKLQGFVTAMIVEVETLDTRTRLKVMDLHGLYDFSVTEILGPLIEGIHLGFFVKKQDPRSRKKSFVFNVLEQQLKPQTTNFEVTKYVFPKFSKNSWSNTSDSKVVVVSDVHVGNLTFCSENFVNLMKRISHDPKIKYLLINGDVVDGCEVYPGQRKDLQIPSFMDQYKQLAKYLDLLRHDITIVLSPGNHDFTGKVEPQTFPHQIRSIFAHMKNVIFGPNPGFYRIDGVYFYLTHGTSYNSILKNVSSLDYTRCAEVSAYLADCRYVSPIRKAVPISPNQNLHHFVPEQMNVMCSGHMHNQNIVRYDENRMLVATGAWQELTPYMDLLGLKPDVSKGVCIDLSKPFSYEQWDLKDQTTQTHTYQNAIVKKAYTQF